MTKRFIDTEIWNKEWFQLLNLKHKVLVKYIFENCDCAGVWEINFRLASFVIGEQITIQDIEEINKAKQQFEIFEDDKIFVTNFIKFQYGTLSENCKPHKSIIEKLKKYGLYERVCKGYAKGMETLEEKEQEQYKEKDKENNLSSLVLSSLNDDQKILGCYQNVCLTSEQYTEFISLCNGKKIADELIDSFSENIETGKETPYTAMLPNSHFIRLKKYRDFRMKNPDKFRKKEEKQDDYQAQLNAWISKHREDNKDEHTRMLNGSG